jgi:NAD(P)-dependent dehydrogenase (short-subunit alcohol dehydrogenase family)
MDWPKADVTGRVVVITGAARGMGIAATQAFLAEGAHVVALDRSWEGIDLTALQRLGNGIFLDTDITSDSALDAAYDATLAAFGTVHAVINNAAIIPRVLYPPMGDAKILDTSDADWQKTFDVNLFGALKVIRRFVRPMLEQRRGSIVNVSSPRSWVALAPESREQPYMASKAALTNLSFYLADELKESNVAVNIVFPTGTKSTGWEEMAAQKRARGLPIGTPMEPDFIVPLLLFLAQIDGSYGLTGEAISTVKWNREHGFGTIEAWTGLGATATSAVPAAR